MSDTRDGWQDWTQANDGGRERVLTQGGVVRERVHDSADGRVHTVTHYGPDGRPQQQVQQTRERPGGPMTEVRRTFGADGRVTGETPPRRADGGGDRMDSRPQRGTGDAGPSRTELRDAGRR